MTARPWMPFYFGDYLADTGHLSTLEHGTYLLLIAHYWMKGGLPSDDHQLARVARLTAAQWQRVKPVVQAFFSDGWKHKRIEFELTEAARISEAGRKGGKASALARSSSKSLENNKQDSTTVERPLNDHANDSSTIGQALQPQPQSQEEKKKEKKPAKSLLPDDWVVKLSHYDLGRSKNLTSSEVDEAADEMRSWSLGNDEKRANWDWVFNNWLRRNAAKKGVNNGHRGSRSLQDDSLSVSRAAERLATEVRQGNVQFAPRPSLLPRQSQDDLRLLPPGRSAGP